MGSCVGPEVMSTRRPDSGPAIDLGTSALVAGVAILDVSSLAVGTYRFVATYAGDGTVAAAESAQLPHTVDKGAVTVDVESGATSVAQTMSLRK